MTFFNLNTSHSHKLRKVMAQASTEQCRTPQSVSSKYLMPLLFSIYC